jgi:hypothetical protein
MATAEVHRAALAVEEARRCLQQCERDLASAQRRRDDALQRQERLRVELGRIDRSLNLLPGLAGQQQLLTGNARELRGRRQEILRILTAAPG